MAIAPIRTKPQRHVGTSPFHSTVGSLAANEYVFAVVGPVGSGTSEIGDALLAVLSNAGCDVIPLKARTVIIEWSKRKGLAPLPPGGLLQTRKLQDLGDDMREGCGDNAAIAVGLIGQIRAKRAEKQRVQLTDDDAVEPNGERRAFILDSLRHPQEVALLRRVYQDAFCLIGVFCDQDERYRRLHEDKFPDAGKTDIEEFMKRDEDAPEAHGQKVSETFHLADYFVDNSKLRFLTKAGGQKQENKEWDVADQLGRLLDVLTHSRIVRPRPNETGMFHAYGAKMRSSCLSRQVGAALVDRSGNIIATGTNEVPQAGGGVYGMLPQGQAIADPSPAHDFRCFIHNKFCSNTKEQNKIIEDLFSDVEELRNIKLDSNLIKRIRKTRIGQLLEFSRAVHAEMDALLSAGRSGTATTGTTLYVTTFPCHNCARHIVTAGVDEVQYIEPYLKSKAIPLHGDAIVTDPKQWNSPWKSAPDLNVNPNVLFRPFIGVAPRLYRRAFLKDRELKDNITGEMVFKFGPSEGHSTTDALKVSYAQVEARLARTLEQTYG